MYIVLYYKRSVYNYAGVSVSNERLMSLNVDPLDIRKVGGNEKQRILAEKYDNSEAQEGRSLLCEIRYTPKIASQASPKNSNEINTTIRSTNNRDFYHDGIATHLRGQHIACNPWPPCTWACARTAKSHKRCLFRKWISSCTSDGASSISGGEKPKQVRWVLENKGRMGEAVGQLIAGWFGLIESAIYISWINTTQRVLWIRYVDKGITGAGEIILFNEMSLDQFPGCHLLSAF